MCKQHPEVKKELDQIQEALENYLVENEVKPRPSLKNKIMDTIASLNKEAALDAYFHARAGLA